MRPPVEERRCHLGIAEDRYPFTELQVGGDDDTIQWRQLPNDLSCGSISLLLDQRVDQIDELPIPAFGLHVMVFDAEYGDWQLPIHKRCAITQRTGFAFQ